MNTRNKYDSFIIWLYNQNKENLIPDQVKRQIPHSTASSWRNLDYSNYFGHEVRQMQSEAMEYYELLEKHKNLKRTFKVITKVWINVSKVAMPILHKSKKHHELVVNEIQHLFTVLKKSYVFRLARISSSTYSSRLNRLKVKCGLSPYSLCLKRHPLQLSISEILKIKKLFNNPKFQCWPASSLYYHGLRSENLFISKSTFYNYKNLLGFSRKWTKAKKNKVGIQAKGPNEYLHVDTTFWDLKDNVKAAIVFVSDNFSKMILGWSIALTKDAENVKAALQQTIKTIHKYHPKHITTTLVADGGSENNNQTIDELLLEITQPEITKVIALKDISFSNSPVEAINKIVKRYLRHFAPNTLKKLKNCIQWIEEDYNKVRPHGSLNGLIPIEFYTKKKENLDYKQEKINAKALRILQNQKTNCSDCI